MKSDFVYFIKGRLKFGSCKTPAPFPSMLVYFDTHALGSPEFATWDQKDA